MLKAPPTADTTTRISQTDLGLAAGEAATALPMPERPLSDRNKVTRNDDTRRTAIERLLAAAPNDQLMRGDDPRLARRPQARDAAELIPEQSEGGSHA